MTLTDPELLAKVGPRPNTVQMPEPSGPMLPPGAQKKKALPQPQLQSPALGAYMGAGEGALHPTQDASGVNGGLVQLGKNMGQGAMMLLPSAEQVAHWKQHILYGDQTPPPPSQVPDMPTPTNPVTQPQEAPQSTEQQNFGQDYRVPRTSAPPAFPSTQKPYWNKGGTPPTEGSMAQQIMAKRTEMDANPQAYAQASDLGSIVEGIRQQTEANINRPPPQYKSGFGNFLGADTTFNSMLNLGQGPKDSMEMGNQRIQQALQAELSKYMPAEHLMGLHASNAGIGNEEAKILSQMIPWEQDPQKKAMMYRKFQELMGMTPEPAVQPTTATTVAPKPQQGFLESFGRGFAPTAAGALAGAKMPGPWPVKAGAAVLGGIAANTGLNKFLPPTEPANNWGEVAGGLVGLMTPNAMGMKPFWSKLAKPPATKTASDAAVEMENTAKAQAPTVVKATPVKERLALPWNGAPANVKRTPSGAIPMGDQPIDTSMKGDPAIRAVLGQAEVGGALAKPAVPFQAEQFPLPLKPKAATGLAAAGPAVEKASKAKAKKPAPKKEKP